VILTEGRVLRVPLAELKVDDIAESATRTLQQAERDYIIRVLKETRGLISGQHGAAARLGVKRTTLQSKMRKLGISRREYSN
jgi:transcriptional regulator with GAF, ATPase, and Fis domain